MYNFSKEDPLYNYLKEQKHGIIKKIKWNFEEFLVDKEGNVVERYPSTTKPEDIDKKIEELLK